MHQNPTLNCDILLQLLSHCGRREVSAMMKTCKLLHREGAQFLLKDCISLRSAKAIRSFVMFMISPEHPYRLRCTLRLRFDAQTRLSPDVVVPFARMVQDFGPRLRFRVLELGGGQAERMLTCFPKLLTAFSASHHIDHLIVSGAGPKFIRMLESMRWRVTEASIDLYSNNDNRPPLYGSTEMIDPTVVLRAFRESLRTFRGQGFTTLPGYHLGEGAVTFPNLVNLVLTTYDPINVLLYAKAFPNITHLSTRTKNRFFHPTLCGTDSCSCSEGHVQSLISWREQSQYAQRAHAGSWSANLLQYKGTLSDLWILGVQCQVDRLTLDSDILRTAQWPLKLTDVLRDSCARYLDLCLQSPTTTAIQDVMRVLRQFRGRLQMVRIIIRFNTGLSDVHCETRHPPEGCGASWDVCGVQVSTNRSQMQTHLQSRAKCATTQDAFVTMVRDLELRYLAIRVVGLPESSPIYISEGRTGKQAGASGRRELDVWHAFLDRIQGAALPLLQGLHIELSSGNRLRSDVVHLGERLPVLLQLDDPPW